MEFTLLNLTMGTTTIWLLLFVLFLLVEVITAGNLVSIWFCAGSLAAAAVSAAGFGVNVQSIVFVLSSAAMIIFLKPIAARLLSKGFQPTNIDRIIGQKGIVTEEISNLSGLGAVKIDGKIWTAINMEGDESVPTGTEVTVEEINGVKVFVKKV